MSQQHGGWARWAPGWVGTVVAVWSLAGAADLAGQIAWESPLMVSPQSPAGWSLHLMDPEPGDGIAAMVGWRTSPVPVGFGARAGIGEGADGDVAVFAGIDASGILVRYTDETPLDLIWVAGGGFGVGDHVLLSFPAALVAGWDIPTEDVSFRPYVGPRVVLDARIGEGTDDDLDLEAALDLGLDLAFDAGLVLRFAASIGSREALSAGIAFTSRRPRPE